MQDVLGLSDSRLRLESLDLLLKVRKVTFSCDTSPKWLSLWSVIENLDWSLQGPLCAEEFLDRFRTIFLVTTEQYLAAESLIRGKV
jgi:hypothetical protein